MPIKRSKIDKFSRLAGLVVISCLFSQGVSIAGTYAWIPRTSFHPEAVSSVTADELDSRLSDYFRGINLYRAGQWALAATVFETLLEKDPKSSIAAGAAADAYRKLRQHDKAPSFYDLAARLCREKLQRRSQWGLNLDIIPPTADLIYYQYRLGQLDAGWKLLASMETGIREKLAGPAAMLLFARGQIKEAREKFCQALKDAPRDPRLLDFKTEAREAGHDFVCPQERPPVTTTNAHALIIGIGQYEDRGISRLDHPVDDALCIYKALNNARYSLFNSKNVVVLLDRQATTAAIKKKLLLLGQKALDMVLIYFSGRIAWERKDAYWITHDTLPSRLAATGLSSRAIAGTLKSYRTRRLAVFVEGYHSMAPERDASIFAGPVSVDKRRETVFITKATGIGVSGRQKVERHCVFSPSLCEVLRGKGDENRDGLTNIHEAWSYMEKHFSRAACDQKPVIGGTYTGDFVISGNPLKR